jgi:N-acetylmuramoyl-L-alanine amidase
MRPIRKFILHASGQKSDTLKEIDARHRARGLRCAGFHYVIRENGKLERARPLTEAGAHCLGYNSDSVGICLCGTGEPMDEQMQKLAGLLEKLKRKFPAAELCRAGELDPWIRDPLRLNAKLLRKEIRR